MCAERHGALRATFEADPPSRRRHPTPPCAVAAQKCDVKELTSCKASLKTTETSLKTAQTSLR